MGIEFWEGPVRCSRGPDTGVLLVIVHVACVARAVLHPAAVRALASDLGP